MTVVVLHDHNLDLEPNKSRVIICKLILEVEVLCK